MFLTKLIQKWRLAWLVCAPLCGLVLAAPAGAQPLVVAADSSLGDALTVVARQFEAQRPGAKLTLRLGASGVLLSQIAQGMVTDVLASADTQTAAQGVQRRLLVADLRQAFASNTLVLVVPVAQKQAVQRMTDLTKPEVARIALGRLASEPSGRYAREAINGQRLWPSLQQKLVYADDARAVLALVAQAEVAAGFVYATDAATASGQVHVVQTLATTTPIRSVVNLATASTQPALAAEFVAYLRSAPALAVLKQAGFGPP
jgi:molybdate transport system substrate-binding protein